MRSVQSHLGSTGHDQGPDGVPEVQEPLLEQATAGEGEEEGTEVSAKRSNGAEQRVRDPAVTSKIMSAVKSKDTAPELLLRHALHREGLRFTLQSKKVPGRPDVVFPSKRLAVFVDGDYWHGNSWRERGFDSLEHQFKHWKNTEFWTRKIHENIRRDRRTDASLREQGWHTLRLWESELLRDLPACVNRVKTALLDESAPNERFTSLEMFTGAGGLALGLAAAGFDHVAIVERDKHACATIRANQQRLPHVAHWPLFETDVRRFDFTPYRERVTLLAAGAPCQPFSLGGKHAGDQDNRNMFPEVMRAVRELRPQAVIVENVKGLLRTSFRDYFEYILLQLQRPDMVTKSREDWRAHKDRLTKTRSAGEYRVAFQLVNCADFGVPQLRQRVFVVAFRADLGLAWKPLLPTHSKQALLFAQLGDLSYWQEHGIRTPRVSAVQRSLYADLARPGLERWRTARDVLAGLPDPVDGKEHARFANHVGNPGARSYPGHTGSPLDWPAKTLKAGVHGVPGGENTLRLEDGRVRYLSVREAARIQTFPDDYLFRGAWGECLRQIGNAVPVQMAQLVAGRVRETLDTLEDSGASSSSGARKRILTMAE